MVSSESMRKKLRIGNRYSPVNDVTLFSGDCLALLKQIPDRSVRLVVTSPPYNLGKAYERKQELKEYLELQKSVIAECVRSTPVCGRILLAGGKSHERSRSYCSP